MTANPIGFALAVLLGVTLFAASPGLAIVVGIIAASHFSSATTKRAANRRAARHAWGDW